MQPQIPELELDNFTLHKNEGLRVVVGITCLLSLLGSLLIILSYILFKDLRTSARLILVHLSIADFGVAFSNLFGEFYRFDRHFNRTVMKLSPHHVQSVCEAQAFAAHFFTISSVLWTMALAAFMYIVVTKLKNKVPNDNWFVRFSYLFCYGMPLLVSVWMVLTHKLGFSPFDTAGWCGSIMHKLEPGTSPSRHNMDYMTAVLGYDLWIVLTFVFIIVTYLSIHFYTREEVGVVRWQMAGLGLKLKFFRLIKCPVLSCHGFTESWWKTTRERGGGEGGQRGLPSPLQKSGL